MSLLSFDRFGEDIVAALGGRPLKRGDGIDIQLADGKWIAARFQGTMFHDNLAIIRVMFSIVFAGSPDPVIITLPHTTQVRLPKTTEIPIAMEEEFAPTPTSSRPHQPAVVAARPAVARVAPVGTVPPTAGTTRAVVAGAVASMPIPTAQEAALAQAEMGGGEGYREITFEGDGFRETSKKSYIGRETRFHCPLCDHAIHLSKQQAFFGKPNCPNSGKLHAARAMDPISEETYKQWQQRQLAKQGNPAQRVKR